MQCPNSKMSTTQASSTHAVAAAVKSKREAAAGHSNSSVKHRDLIGHRCIRMREKVAVHEVRVSHPVEKARSRHPGAAGDGHDVADPGPVSWLERVGPVL